MSNDNAFERVPDAVIPKNRRNAFVRVLGSLVGWGMFFGLAVLSKELFVFSVIPAWLFLGLRRESVATNLYQRCANPPPGTCAPPGQAALQSDVEVLAQANRPIQRSFGLG